MISTPTGAAANSSSTSLSLSSPSRKPFAEQLACGRIRPRGTVRKTHRARFRQQRVQNSFFGGVFGAQADFFELLLTQHLHGSIGQVAE